MIFITGDTHGSIDIEKLSGKRFPAGKRLNRQDYVIICGDFGLPFLSSDTCDPNEFVSNKHARSSQKSYRYWIKWLSERPFTVLWVDGNHDNHPFWYQQPVTEWNGGLVNLHPDAENVIHLKRGEYYTIDGHTFWTMGGAESHDKTDRIPDYNWWQGEIPSHQEKQHGLDTLAAHGKKVDYIITHTMPQCLVAPYFGGNFKSEPTRDYFDRIYAETAFKYWFCGHLHTDLNKSGYKLQILYQEILPLSQFE